MVAADGRGAVGRLTLQDAGWGHAGQEVPSAGHYRSTWNPGGADVRGSEVLGLGSIARRTTSVELVMSRGVASSLWSSRLRCGVAPAFGADRMLEREAIEPFVPN